MRSLTWKLALAFLLVSVFGVGVAAVFMQVATQNSFQNVVNNRAESDFQTAVTGYYQQTGSWDGVQSYVRRIQGQTAGPNQSQPNQQGPGAGGPPANGARPLPSFILVDAHGVVVVSGRTHQLGDVLSPDESAKGDAVTVNNQIVGYVLSDGSSPALSSAETAFLASTQRALIVGTLAALLVALLIGIVLARTLTHPVRELTAALRRMAGGELRQAVRVRSRDELGELTVAFNRMSLDLERANQQRRQMTADIAHELRTPMTVIAGYLEALRDGVLPATPERFTVLYDEAHHLQGLIEDLRTLSLSDAGELVLQREGTTPHALLVRIAGIYRHHAEQQGITLEVVAPETLPPITVDVQRMVQVLSNLVGNALRYTPMGGTITLAASQVTHGPAGTLLVVRDNGQGIAPDALPHVFDRFYRADRARAQAQGREGRAQGESGLGLSIAKALVEAHGGSIDVASQLGTGTTFTILLPNENTPLVS